MHQKSEDGTAISTDIILDNPPFFVFSLTLVMWLVVLVERVVDALFEDFIRILWPVRALWSWFRVRETEFPKKGTEIIWAVGNAKFLLEKMLNLLRFPRLAVTKHLHQLVLLILVEFRGPPAPETRHEFFEAPFVPVLCPACPCCC
jgi:hypothetical protein